MKKEHDLTNRKFYRYTVLEYSHYKLPHHYWLCQCDCGIKKVVQGAHLKSGHTKSCGCWNSEVTIKNNIARGSNKTPMYRVWRAMISRCYNIKNDSYKDYGGRGITVCDEWRNNKDLFYKWCRISGYKKGLSIERIRVHGNYEPSNCTWIPMSEQQRNTTKTKLNLTRVGIIRSLYKRGVFSITKIAAIYGVSIGTISMVVNNKTWV